MVMPVNSSGGESHFVEGGGEATIKQARIDHVNLN